jgi:hypothetical protein
MKTSNAQMLLAGALLSVKCPMLSAADAGAPRLDALVGQPADIAPSAYQYRADRKPEENPPSRSNAAFHRGDCAAAIMFFSAQISVVAIEECPNDDTSDFDSVFGTQPGACIVPQLVGMPVRREYAGRLAGGDGASVGEMA